MVEPKKKKKETFRPDVVETSSNRNGEHCWVWYGFVFGFELGDRVILQTEYRSIDQGGTSEVENDFCIIENTMHVFRKKHNAIFPL